mgnify:CR=1 FL=1
MSPRPCASGCATGAISRSPIASTASAFTLEPNFSREHGRCSRPEVVFEGHARGHFEPANDDCYVVPKRRRGQARIRRMRVISEGMPKRIGGPQ